MSENWWEADAPAAEAPRPPVAPSAGGTESSPADDWWAEDTPADAEQSWEDLGARAGRGLANVGAGAVAGGVAIETRGTPAMADWRQQTEQRASRLDEQEAFIQGVIRSGVRPDGQRLTPAEVVDLLDDLQRIRQDTGRVRQALDLTTPKPVDRLEDTQSYQAAEEIRRRAAATFGEPDPAFDGRLSSMLAEGLGNVAGFVLLSATTRSPGGAFAGAGMNAEQIYREAIASGADEETARLAARWGAVVGSSEILPIMRALEPLESRLPGIGNSVAAAIAKRVARSAVEEGSQESLAQIANNLIAQKLYHPERGWAEGVTEAAIVGAILGGGLGAGGATANAAIDAVRQPASQAAPELAPDAAAALGEAQTTPPAATPTTGASAASSVAPDEAAALARDVLTGLRTPATPEPPKGPDATQPAPETVPEATPDPAVTPEGNEPEAEVAVEPETVPEAPETIEAQRQALLRGTKTAVLYTPGTVLPPELDTKRFNRVNIPGVGVIDYDKKKITQQEIRALAKFGKLNEVLELGPYNKQDVVESAARGAEPVAVVEQTPDGTEVKTAAGTTETLPDQLAALEETKTAPENEVVTQSPVAVLAERLAERQAPTPAPAPAQPPVAAPAAPSTPPRAPTRTPAEIMEALDEQERIKAARTPAPAPAPITTEAPNPAGPTAAPVTPEVTPEPAPPADPTKARVVGTTPTGGRIFQAPTAPEVAEATEQYNQKIAQRGGEEKAKEVSKARSAKREEQKGGPREERLAKVRQEIADGKYKTPAEQAGALAIAGGKNLKIAERQKRQKDAETAAELQEQFVPDNFEQVTTTEQKKALLRDLTALKGLAESRGFPFTRMADTDTGAVVWLKDVETVRKKLEADKISYADLNSRLAGWAAARKGVDENIRDTRREEGDAAKKRTGNVDNVAALPAEEVTVDESAGDVMDIAEREDAAAERDAAELADPETELTARVTKSSKRQIENFNEETSERIAKESAKTGLAEGMSAEEKAALAAKYFTAAKKRRAKRNAEGAQPEFDQAAYVAWAKSLTDEQSAFLKAVDEEGGVPWHDLPAEVKAEISARFGFTSENGPEALFSKKTMLLRDVFKRMVSAKTRDAIMMEALSGYAGRTDGDLGRLQNDVGAKLFETIVDVVGDTKVHVVDPFAVDLIIEDASGWFSPVTADIAISEDIISDPNELAHVALHEGAHAAFSALLDNNPDAKKTVDRLRQLVANKADKAGFETENENYWNANADEFVSEFFSNPEFQEFLAQTSLTKGEIARLGIPTARSSRVKTALDAIKAAIVDVLGLQPLVRMFARESKSSAFDVAMDLAGAMLDVAADYNAYDRAQVRAAFGETPKPVKTGKRAGRAKRPQLKVHTLEARLEWRGLNGETAKQVAEMIRAEFDGKASNVELDAIVERITGEAPKVTAVGNRMERKAEAHHQRTITQIRREGEKMADQAMELAQKDFVPGKNPGRPRLLKVLTNYQIAEIGDRFFGADSNPLRKVAEMIERRRVGKARHLKELTPVVQKLMEAKKRHTAEEWTAFISLAHDATMANVHPDRSLEDNKHLGKKRLSTAWNKSQHADLAARWAALPSPLKDLYLETRDTLTETQNQMTRGLIQNILGKVGVTDPAVVDRFFENKPTDADKELVGPELAAHIEDATELKKIEGPYFNLVRRGDYVVQGTYQVKPPTAPHMKRAGNVYEFLRREDAEAYAGQQDLRTTVQSLYVDKNTGERFAVDDDGTEVRISKNDADAEQRFRVTIQNRHVEFVDTRAEALLRQDELRKAGVKVVDIEPKRFERQAQNAEMLSEQMRAIASTVEKRQAESKLSKAQQAELRQTLQEISLRFLGSTRIQSNRLPRGYIEGASKDLVRNTFEYIDSASGYLARLETAPRLETALTDMEKRVVTLGRENTGAAEGARALTNEIEERVYRPFDVDDGFLQNATTRITNIAFIDALASPAYSFINATQVGMFTMPVLSADFNIASAGYQIQKAYRELGAVRMLGGGAADTGRALTGKTVLPDRYIDDVMKRLTEPRERQMVEELAASGLIDADGGMEVARVLNRREGGALGAFDWVLQKADNLARAMPQAVEAINRTTSALAAYRLHFNKHRDHEKAIQYAKDVVNDTQALMSNSNAAPIFSHPIFRISLQFKKFGQMAYYLLGKNIGRTFRPMNKGDRIKGMKALAYLTATHATFAGLVGVPGLEALKVGMMLFNGAIAGAGEQVEWEEFEEWVRGYMAQLTGSERAADMATFGVTRGIPGGWGFDLNSRLGMDSLLLFGEPRGNSAEDYKTYLLDTLAGPAGRTTFDALQGATAALEGDYSGVHKMLPFKMVADIGNALTRGAEGKMDTQDMILRAVGLQSARQADIYRGIGQEIRESRRARAERDALVNDYIRAGSPEELRAARLAIQRFNRSAKDGQRSITTKGLDEIRRRDQLRYAN